MNQMLHRWICLVLAMAMLLSLVALLGGCSTPSDDPANENTESVFGESESVTDGGDHRFDNVNYDGREFRIYTSTSISNSALGSSNFMIEGLGETNGDLINDAVFERNVSVEEMLGVELVFTQADLAYQQVAPTLRKLAVSGTDEFDLVINDIFGFADLVIEGNFRNILDDECVFDFNRDYWYKDYMEDLRLMNGYQYILAGDYFIDILRCARLLILNKQLYMDYYHRSADELYEVVLDYEWTYDRLLEIVSDKYDDKNGNGVKDLGDQYGFMENGYWYGCVGFAVSGNPNFITRDEDGIPTVVIHEGDRSNQLAAKMTALFNNASTALDLAGGVDLLAAFTEGDCFVTPLKLGMLENTLLREMEDDCVVLPHPMLFASDKKYTTSAHDITEMGAILTTAKDMEFISTVIEVLNRETAKTVMPVYYDEKLQVQYVDDEHSGAMIDIIHDNFDNSFILAYNHVLNYSILESFAAAMQENREFSAVYAKNKNSVARVLESKIKKFQEKNHAY